MEIRRTLEDLRSPAREDCRDGTVLRAALSDVPQAITVRADNKARTLQLAFEYVNDEETVQEYKGGNMLIVRGRYSGKLLRLTVGNVNVENRAQSIFTLRQTVENERRSAKRINQQLNYEIISSILGSRLEPMLELMAT